MGAGEGSEDRYTVYLEKPTRWNRKRVKKGRGAKQRENGGTEYTVCKIGQFESS
ncbi:MAG: hypothetical protein ACI4W2_00875 [Eubacterium sp.]